MHADIIGVPMYTTVESQSAGCLGDCIIAAVGVGIYPNFWEAADSMIRVDKEYIPNMEAHKEYQFYMDLRKYGSTRHSGFGLGFERCIMYLTGMSNIRDVIPFPRTVNNCEL